MKFKEKAKGLLQTLAIASTAAYYGNTAVYCAGSPFDTAVNALGEVKTGLVSVGKELFPIALIGICVALFITHDERKLQIEMKIGLALCVCYILLIMLSNGNSIQTWLETLAA